ncbi:hypothetical protein [Microbacterium soli]|uniref:Uncharacterized protein n=1 Tax=Microbacterium soli TaxID=446075 RepID=A0ABP7N386_9MICO
MSTLAVTNTLSSVFLPIGIAGAVIAVVCALVALIALARGAAGLVGGAIGVWIGGAMLSLASSFADDWIPVLVALVALGGGLVLGAAVRVVVRGVLASRPAVAQQAWMPEAQAQPVRMPAPARATASERIRAVA